MTSHASFLSRKSKKQKRKEKEKSNQEK